MEKINGGLRRNQVQCVLLAAFIFSFLSLYYAFSNSACSKNVFISSTTKGYFFSMLGMVHQTSDSLKNQFYGLSPSPLEKIEDNGGKTVGKGESGLVDDLNSVHDKTGNQSVQKHPKLVTDPCAGRYVYVHNLPSKFNTDLLKECRTLIKFFDMCPSLVNDGQGPAIENFSGVFPSKGWFETNQFTLDIIFHNRMKQYECLTENSSLAAAIYVPFYSGLDIGRHLWGGFNMSIRDSTSHELLRWLTSKPEWQVKGGRDHFLTAGRIVWDFIRIINNESEWGSDFLVTPEAKNMSVLIIETAPLHSNAIAIPYPTYFHPSTDKEVFDWQKRVQIQKKPDLFSFVGAPRPEQSISIRGFIIEQCEASKGKCRFLNCDESPGTCSPSNVMKTFLKSVFCLQPPGDSYTRRSTFDSILAGCIPVFFHPQSAYEQYIWHLPPDHTTYSVHISDAEIRNKTANIEQILSRIPRKKVMDMKKEVINLIPKVIYADGRSRLDKLEDAFDIAVKRVIQRVNEVRPTGRES